MKNIEEQINTIPANFDEQQYLRTNSDVAQAVATGKIKSGLEHYHKFGRFEQLPPKVALGIK